MVLASKGDSGDNLSVRVPVFKFTKSPRGYVVNTPASLSDTGKRTRRYFATQDEARGACAELRTRFLNHGTAAPTLPPGQTDLAARAFKMLEEVGCPKETILSAVRMYIDRIKAEAKSVTFSEACEAYGKAKKYRSPRHLADIRRLPRRFCDIADKLVVSIQPEEIEAHLVKLPGPMKNLLLRQTRAILNFAVRRNWASENVANRIDLAHVADPKIQVLTGDQLGHLFKQVVINNPALCPLLAVEAFAGVRPAEAERLSWSDIDFEDGTLTVSSQAAKTRRARHIIMHPTLRVWLEWSIAQGMVAEGSIAPFKSVTLLRRLRILRKQAGIDPWPQDCLRHTFASASLATGWRDIGGLCLDLGHTSQAMLHKHYHRALKPAEGRAVFSVYPPDAPEIR